MYGAGYFIDSIAGLESETTIALSMAVGTFAGKSL